MMKKYQYHKKIRIGAAGGIGTPEAAAVAYMLGAEFIMTGSINQCTVEAELVLQ
jgi:trans-AT polyketide synthase/acyltransferase/oxidoreductase domain-containing protein